MECDALCENFRSVAFQFGLVALEYLLIMIYHSGFQGPYFRRAESIEREATNIEPKTPWLPVIIPDVMT